MRKGFRARLITALLSDKAITEEQLQQAQESSDSSGKSLEDTLVDMGFLNSEEMLSYRSLEMDVVPFHLSNLSIPTEVTQLIPERLATRYRLIPISRIKNALTVAMANPLDIHTIDEIEMRTGMTIVPVMSHEEEIQSAIKRCYQKRESVDEYLEKIVDVEDVEVEAISQEEEDEADLEQLAKEAPVVGLVNVIFQQAIQDRASDIHIEPHEGHTRVRYRIDGILYEVETLSRSLHPAVVSRIKIMANMNIAERRRPQDSRIKYGADVDVRVSTIPTMFGEKIVMRLADQSKGATKLESLGMSDDILERFVETISLPHGMILVTGPTGSGKTTTLYSALNRLNTPDVNIITIEDPVEYIVPGLNQVPINPKAGLTFATALRSILRQDPDIIMVGEIRDSETAKIGVESALTGHLVFSTLHTNDAPGALTRLLDMDVESFLISASIECVLAQRLVGVLCPNCKQPYTPSEELKEKLKLPPDEEYTFYRKVGCDFCRNRGYLGRVGVFEVMFVNDDIRALILEKSDTRSIRQAALESGMKTLFESAVMKVVEGLTTPEEAYRVAEER